MDEALKRLTCTQCKHWSPQARNWDITESTIKVAVCTPEEVRAEPIRRCV